MRRSLLLIVLLFVLAPVAGGQDTAKADLRTLLQTLDTEVLTTRERDRVVTYRAKLAALDRDALDDDEWVDLHCALMAVERALNPYPRGRDAAGAPLPDDAHEIDLLFEREGLRPVGRERFEWALRYTHGLSLDAETVRAIGLDARQRARKMLVEHAKENGADDWQFLLGRAQVDRPLTYEELVEDARQAVAHARDATLRSGLVSIPDGGKGLKVSGAGSQFPYAFAAYQPGRFDNGVFRGHYTLAPLPPNLDAANKAEWLRDFDQHFMRVVTAHESFPGHHLQFTHAARVKRPVRKLAYNSVYVEGWGLYSEGLIERMGGLDGPLDRLAALRMRAWRAVRCDADPALHSGWMKPSEVVENLITESGMSRRAAIREVRMYLNRPTQALSYEIGRRIIESTRDAYIAQHGEAALREFHDRLLGLGVVPLPLARAVLLEERATYDRLRP